MGKRRRVGGEVSPTKSAEKASPTKPQAEKTSPIKAALEASTYKSPAGGFVPRQVHVKHRPNPKIARRPPPSHQKALLSSSSYLDKQNPSDAPEKKSLPQTPTNLGTNDSFRLEKWRESPRASCWQDSWDRARARQVADGSWREPDRSPSPQQRETRGRSHFNADLLKYVPRKQDYPNARWRDGTPFDWDGKPKTPQARYQKHVRPEVRRDGSVPRLRMSPEKFRASTGFSADPCVYEPLSPGSEPALGATEVVRGYRNPSLPPVGYDHFRVQEPQRKLDMRAIGAPFPLSVDCKNYHRTEAQAKLADRAYHVNQAKGKLIPPEDKAALRTWNKEQAELNAKAGELYGRAAKERKEVREKYIGSDQGLSRIGHDMRRLQVGMAQIKRKEWTAKNLTRSV